jgi:hypothetical protein
MVQVGSQNFVCLRIFSFAFRLYTNLAKSSYGLSLVPGNGIARTHSLTHSRTNELTTIEDESYLSEVVSSSFCNTLDSTAAKRALIREVGVEHQMGFAFIFILFCEIHWEIDLVSISFPLLGPHSKISTLVGPLPTY